MRMRGPGRGALVAGLLALLFGVISGFEISVHLELDEGHHEKPKVDSHLELATKEKLQARASKEFDFFVLSQRWPGMYCQRLAECCKHLPEPVIFTLFGFWPEYSDFSYPKCCSGPAFDQNKIHDLTDPLQEYWPGTSCSSPELCDGKEADSLWQQQWEKHGTCALPIIPDQATYFTAALDLRSKYDMSKILNDAGFLPGYGKAYETRDVLAAVRDAVNARPVLTCRSNSFLDGQLDEIWICVTKELEVMDCPSNSDHDSCPDILVIPPFWWRVSSVPAMI